MKKLFIFQDNKTPYRSELEAAFGQTLNMKESIDLQSLAVDYLLKNGIEIVISNGLSNTWYYTLKGMNIVSVVLGNRDLHKDYADIVIDYLSDDDKRYFTGNEYSLCTPNQASGFQINEIINLIKILKWDSDFFGFNVAYLSCMHLTQNIVRRIEKFIQKENVRLIEYLCNCHDRRSVRCAERNGFNFVDMRLTYIIKLTEKENVLLSGLEFRKAVSADVAELQRISEKIYQDSRYYFDGNFDILKVQEFYRDWMRKGVQGEFDDECWCFYDKETPIAYTTIKYDSAHTASIGLVGVNPGLRGRGLAQKMLLSVFGELRARGVEHVCVVTQGRNYAAQCLYQSVGFRTKATQLWYHKWL